MLVLGGSHLMRMTSFRGCVANLLVVNTYSIALFIMLMLGGFIIIIENYFISSNPYMSKEEGGNSGQLI